MNNNQGVYEAIQNKRDELTQSSAPERCGNDVDNLGDLCIAQINSTFFLLIEIENKQDDVIVVSISAELAAALLAAGVDRCPIVTAVPTATAGVMVEPICAFVAEGFVFVVFNIEKNNGRDRLVLLRVPFCTEIPADLAQLQSVKNL